MAAAVVTVKVVALDTLCHSDTVSRLRRIRRSQFAILRCKIPEFQFQTQLSFHQCTSATSKFYLRFPLIAWHALAMSGHILAMALGAARASPGAVLPKVPRGAHILTSALQQSNAFSNFKTIREHSTKKRRETNVAANFLAQVLCRMHLSRHKHKISDSEVK